MKIIETKFKGLKIVEPAVYGDHRGWFSETYSKNKFLDHKIDIDFVQDNQSLSVKRGTLRGVHFQTDPKAQTKLIRCTKGSIIDTVVDLRKGSDTYKEWFSIELTAENKKQLLIPKGFGHAFLTITDNVEVQYKVDEYYSKEHDGSIRFDDPEIAIKWGEKDPILSEKDLNAVLLKDIDLGFSIKVLVTGVNGQLGYDVTKRLNDLGISNVGVCRKDFDLVNKEATQAFIMEYKPDVVVHCAAYTNVDGAEENREECYAVNVEGTVNIAKACRQIDAKMVYISSDYVFGGEGEEPYSEYQETAPINYYGYTKDKGEKAIQEILEKYFIIRTSWLYGENGNNFVNKMFELAKSKKELNIIHDQVGSPTYTKDLAELVCEILQTAKYGIYHGVNDGYCSWYDFAADIFKKMNIDIKLNPITTLEYPVKAKRPLNSRLSRGNIVKNGFSALPHWKDALGRFL